MKTFEDYNLEERLIDFAVIIIKIAAKIHSSFEGYNLSEQLIRSGSSPALHYGEVLSSESRKDFIHKMSVCLKELRETYIALKIIKKLNFKSIENEIEMALKENLELISIFSKAIKTAKSNQS
jgi:four helix bundle protein